MQHFSILLSFSISSSSFFWSGWLQSCVDVSDRKSSVCYWTWYEHIEKIACKTGTLNCICIRTPLIWHLSFIYSILRPKKHARTNRIDCFLLTSVFSLHHSSVTTFFCVLVMEPHYLCLCSLKCVHWNFYETKEFFYWYMMRGRHENFFIN